MVIELNAETFKEKIFDYSGDSEWKFEGDKPGIIKFGAEWCQPCKTVDPILEEIADEYDEKVDVYKVDVDENQELSQVFQIQSIPAILFIPTDALPQMSMGAIPKDVFKKAISEVLKVELS